MVLFGRASSSCLNFTFQALFATIKHSLQGEELTDLPPGRSGPAPGRPWPRHPLGYASLPQPQPLPALSRGTGQTPGGMRPGRPSRAWSPGPDPLRHRPHPCSGLRRAGRWAERPRAVEGRLPAPRRGGVIPCPQAGPGCGLQAQLWAHPGGSTPGPAPAIATRPQRGRGARSRRAQQGARSLRAAPVGVAVATMAGGGV